MAAQNGYTNQTTAKQRVSNNGKWTPPNPKDGPCVELLTGPGITEYGLNAHSAITLRHRVTEKDVTGVVGTFKFAKEVSQGAAAMDMIAEVSSSGSPDKPAVFEGRQTGTDQPFGQFLFVHDSSGGVIHGGASAIKVKVGDELVIKFYERNGKAGPVPLMAYNLG